MNMDKEESILVLEGKFSEQNILSLRTLKTKASLEEKANLIQMNFRKLKSLKILANRFLEKLTNKATPENTKIYATSKKNFIHNIETDIKNLLSDKIGITSLEKTNIHFIIHNFKNIPREKILNDLKIFKIQLDPVIITNKNQDSEIYWGEWNLNYKKHGFGLLITTKQDFYLGTFKENVIDGVGLLIINNQNISIDNNLKEIIYQKLNQNVNSRNKNQNNNTISNKNHSNFTLKNETNIKDNDIKNDENPNNLKNNNDNNVNKNFTFQKTNNNSQINFNLDNSENSIYNQNSICKARGESIYQKNTHFKTFEEKNLNEFYLSKLNENKSKLKNDNEAFLKFVDSSEIDKNYVSKMSDFSKNMIKLMSFPQKQNNTDNKNYDTDYYSQEEKDENKSYNQTTILSNDIYIGEFKKGVADGYGRLFMRTGEWYIGYFKNNKKEGEGEIHFVDGSFYIGNFKNNCLEGEGKYFFKGGCHFSGNFKNNHFCGKGKMAWNDGRMFDGIWDNNNLSGRGTHLWSNGNIYEGNYKQNIKQGKGAYYWNESKYFEGDFLNNKINGKGYFNLENHVLKGGWKFGILNFVNNVKQKNRAFTCDEIFTIKAKQLNIQKADYKEENEKNVETDRDVLPVIAENEY